MTSVLGLAAALILSPSGPASAVGTWKGIYMSVPSQQAKFKDPKIKQMLVQVGGFMKKVSMKLELRVDRTFSITRITTDKEALKNVQNGVWSATGDTLLLRHRKPDPVQMILLLSKDRKKLTQQQQKARVPYLLVFKRA